LRILKNEGAQITISSDSHKADTIDFSIDETKRYLYDIGFRHTLVLYDGHFIKETLV
jgi:histidinol phosphatase-like PHP family hydrolase